MTCIVGITAAPRTVNYLPRTVRSVLNAGASRVAVFAEPGTDLREARGISRIVQVIQRPQRLGNWHNWRSMAELLAATSADWIVTAEDDVEFQPDSITNALRELTVSPCHRVTPSPVGLLSLYTSLKYDLPAGLQPHAPRVLHGACAWLWPRESLRAVLDHPLTAAWTGNTIANKPTPPELMDGVDTLVGRVLRDLGRTMWFCVPSLAQHIGKVSTFAGKSWPPTQHDAPASGSSPAEPQPLAGASC